MIEPVMFLFVIMCTYLVFSIGVVVGMFIARGE